MHPLDNPIYAALTTRQTHLAESRGPAARFAPAVTLLGGVRSPDDESLRALADLLGLGEAVGLFFDAAPALPESLECRLALPLLQMVQESPVDAPAPPAPFEWTELGAGNAAEMLALAELTRPGPFGLRTGEMGTFLGVRAGGALVAMAGQRMWMPGFREISGVCTHPEHLGRGYAAGMMAEIARRIRTAGELPFLHVRAENTRAIGVYERLGFRARRGFEYVQLARAGGV